MTSMAYTDRQDSRTGHAPPLATITALRVVGFALLFVFGCGLTLHVLEHGWDMAGSGAYVVFAFLAFLVAARPGWFAGLFQRGDS